MENYKINFELGDVNRRLKGGYWEKYIRKLFDNVSFTA